MIYNIHTRNTTNVGDQMSGPWHYTYGRMQPFCLYGETRKIPAEANVVVGGGNLAPKRRGYCHSMLGERLQGVKGKKIVWGAGTDGVEDHRYYLEDFDLVGLRDCEETGFEWVPCASCLHKSFDFTWEKEHEVVVYQHSKRYVHNPGVPEMSHLYGTGWKPDLYFEEVLEFLASAETVVTASYHGAYWATLLGCRVFVYPASDKLTRFKHQPVYVDPHDWLRRLGEGASYHTALEECRQATYAFMDKVFNLCA